MNKKIIRISLLSIMIFSLIVGCNKSKFNDNTNSNSIDKKEINPISKSTVINILKAEYGENILINNDDIKLIGNLYFVGSKDSASHLIDTGDGLIMIDTGYPNMAGFNTLNKIFIEEAGLNWRKDFEKSLDIWEWMQTDIYLGNYTPQSNVIKKRSTDEKKSFY